MDDKREGADVKPAAWMIDVDGAREALARNTVAYPVLWDAPHGRDDAVPIYIGSPEYHRQTEARVKALEEALRPFAEHGEALEGCCPTDQWCEAETPDGERVHWLAVEHFLHAARTLPTDPTP